MLSGMRAPIRLIVFVIAAIAASSASGQDARPTNGSKATDAKKATKSTPPVTFDAHNEGAVEGAIYGNENLVSVTIDSTGIRYQGKSMDKPIAIPWDQVSGWQPNNFHVPQPRSHGQRRLWSRSLPGCPLLQFSDQERPRLHRCDQGPSLTGASQRAPGHRVVGRP